MYVHTCTFSKVIFLPVIGGQLATSDIRHRCDPTALVLPIPNGAGHLQHAQDTSIPKMRENMFRLYLTY
jgi:hypothetical protein